MLPLIFVAVLAFRMLPCSSKPDHPLHLMQCDVKQAAMLRHLSKYKIHPSSLGNSEM
jgi:hypothetical protein